jgi:hypothetical protein
LGRKPEDHPMPAEPASSVFTVDELAEYLTISNKK